MPSEIILTLPNDTFVRFHWLDDDQVAALVREYKLAKAAGGSLIVYRIPPGTEPARTAMGEYFTTTPRWIFLQSDPWGWLTTYKSEKAKGDSRYELDLVVWPEAIKLSDLQVTSREGPSKYPHGGKDE